ncbi:hypothetical protein HAX54_045759, partial [Datura stramonium]|nr:hypothetical protein [Datura stramonium]
DTNLHVTAAEDLKSPLGKKGVVYNKHLLFFHLCSQTEPFFRIYQIENNNSGRKIEM